MVLLLAVGILAASDPLAEVGGLAALVERYGLPLIGLIVLGLLGWRGILRWGPQVDKDKKAVSDGAAAQLDALEKRRVDELAARDREIAFREGLWNAEKQARVDAEKALARMVDSFRPVMEGMDDRLESIEKELLRGSK